MGKNYESPLPGHRVDHTTDNFQEWLQTQEGKRAMLKLKTEESLGSNVVDMTVYKDTRSAENAVENVS